MLAVFQLRRVRPASREETGALGGGCGLLPRIASCWCFLNSFLGFLEAQQRHLVVGRFSSWGLVLDLVLGCRLGLVLPSFQGEQTRVQFALWAGTRSST